LTSDFRSIAKQLWPPCRSAGYQEIQAAVNHKGSLTPLEQDLIEALASRHYPDTKRSADLENIMLGSNPADNLKFADAMKKVYQKYPGNLDVAAVYAESLLNLPQDSWGVWTGREKGREHSNPAELNIMIGINVIEDAFDQPGGKDHPALCHLYCHALENSPYPESAIPAADMLRTSMPDYGHLVHMPSHIDIWVGQWEEGLKCNRDGVAADEKYVAENPAMESTFYKFYRMHNLQFTVWCAMHTGEYEVAFEYAKKAEAATPKGDATSGVGLMIGGVIPFGSCFLEAYHGLIWHVFIRFGYV
jgi:hypothetical protein